MCATPQTGGTSVGLMADGCECCACLVLSRQSRGGSAMAISHAARPAAVVRRFKVSPADYPVEATHKQRTQYVIFETGPLGTGMRRQQ